MAVPSISTSDPANGASDVFINKNLTVTFNDALEATSVTENTILLIDKTTGLRESIVPTLSGNTVTLILHRHLKENTAYRILLVGSADAVTDILSGATAGSSDDLVTSLTVDFTTGDDQFQIDTSLEKEAGAKTLEGDLFLPTNVKALGTDFSIRHVRPKNHTAAVAPNITGDLTVRFTFTKPLNTTGIFDTWSAVETFPLFEDRYLGKTGVLKTADPSGLQTFILPTGTLSVDGSDLIFTFDRNFPNNVGLEIELFNTIEDSDGLDFGGGMLYSISTELYPAVVPVRSIKRELRSIEGEFILDDYIDALVHKNAIFLWERTGRGVDITGLSWPAIKHIFSATVLDIIQDRDYNKFLTAGTRRQLGDLNVSVDSLIGRVAMKIAKTQKDMDLAFQTLTKGWQFKTAIKSDSVNGLLNLNRLWYDVNGNFTNPNKKYDQPNIPASNTAVSRRAKTTNPWF